MNTKQIKYGMLAVDVNDKNLGAIDYIVTDSWSGEPRKFLIRGDDGTSALYFISDDIAEITGKKVKLNIPEAEMEKS